MRPSTSPATAGHDDRDPSCRRRDTLDRTGAVAHDRTIDRPARPLTLLVVDDHEVVRQGSSALLDRRPGFQVVAEAGTVAEAIEAARRFQPDLVVMDVRLPDGSGIEACREIRAELPETRVVMLTSYPDEEAVIAAIVAGASGYLLKQVRARDLVAALEAVGRGESLLDPAVTGKVLERMRRIATSDQPDELAALTQQERKILALVAEGKTNKEIAAEVFLSDKTVKNYVSSILAKLNLERRAQAAAYVARLPRPRRRLTGPVGSAAASRGRPGSDQVVVRVAGVELVAEVRVGDRDQRLGALAQALAEQLRDAPLGDDGPDVGARRDDAGALLERRRRSARPCRRPRSTAAR